MARQELVTKDFFTALPFWDKLGKTEQHTLQRETMGFLQARAGAMISRFKMAQHLVNVRPILKSQGDFVAYTNRLPDFGYRTAYRYMEAYTEVTSRVPESVLKLAADRGMDLVGYQADRPFGPYTDAVKALPPPAEPEKAPAWLDAVEEKRKELPRRPRQTRSVPAEAGLKMAFASVYRRFKGVPAGKGRVAWSKRLIGLLMAEMGLPAQTFEPEAVPEGFRPQVGRPKGKAGAG